MNRRKAGIVAVVTIAILSVLQYAVSVPIVQASAPPPPPPPPDDLINEQNVDQWRADWLQGKLTPEEEAMFFEYVEEHIGDNLQDMPPQYIDHSEIGPTLR